MRCQTTTNSTLKINKDRRFGSIIIFVEGEKTEILILKKIFCGILGYKAVAIKKRNDKTFTHVFDIKPTASNANNVFLFNLRKPQIETINDNAYRDKLFGDALRLYGIDLKNKPVYYIWDRDCESNSIEDVKSLMQRLGSATGNTEANPAQDYENGLLLLSYPAVESYVIANLKPVKVITNITLKKYLKKERLKIKDLSDKSLIRAINCMHAQMEEFGIMDYDSDNFSSTNLSILGKEEEYYQKNNAYLLLSLVSIILIDLGVITLEEE